MTGIRRALVTAALTALTAVAGGVLVQPAAWAAQENKISWSLAQVETIREHIAGGDVVCGVSDVAAGARVGVLAGAGAPGVVAGGLVGLSGMLCGGNLQPLRNAVDEAHHRKCGVDAYVTEGPRSYDTRYRYVVCP